MIPAQRPATAGPSLTVNGTIRVTVDNAFLVTAGFPLADIGAASRTPFRADLNGTTSLFK